MVRACNRSGPAKLARALALVLVGLCAVVAARVAGRSGNRLAAPPPPPRVTLSPIERISVAARLVVVAPEATAVVVRHGVERAHLSSVSRIPVPVTGRLSTALIGLPAGATSHVEVVAHYGGGRTLSAGVFTVRTPPMEERVPSSLPVVVDEGVSSGLVMLSMNGGEDVGGLGVIIDRSGRVLWYRHCKGGAFTFELLPNGRIIIHEFEEKGFEEVELDGTLVRKWTDGSSVAGADGHDFKMLPSGNALIFGAETHTVDSRPFFPEGVVQAMRWDDTISEITPSGAVLWRWSSWADISEDEITDYPGEPQNPRDYEVVHSNSMEPMLDGTVLVSFRNLSTVAKIDPHTGRILWRLGGKRSDFRLEGSPADAFYRQHDARLIGPGRILLFDNGNLHDPPESRAAEYRIDERLKTVRLVWQHRRSPPVFSRISGSVQRLPDGHTLIAWGPRGIVSEVDASSKTVWEVRPPEFGVYRARRIAAIYR